MRHARVTAGITREDLGASIGKSAEAVSNIERGIALPTIETLLELAAALNVSILDLIGEKDVSSQKSTKRVELEFQLGSAAKKSSTTGSLQLPSLRWTRWQGRPTAEQILQPTRF